MLNKILYIFSVSIIAFACSSQKKTQEATVESPRPEWVMSKPISSSYYYGIGTVNTKIHSTDYQQIAKNKALEDLASEIEVSVDAQSVLSQKESNQSFIENYQATTRIDVSNNLSDFESIDSWWNESEYWVLYRLSKVEYKQREAEKRSQAINKANHYLDLADAEITFNTHFEYLLQAIDAIKPYLNDPLKSERNKQQIYLGNYVVTRISDRLNMLDLITSNENVELSWANCFKEKLSYSLQYDGAPVESLAIRIQFNSYSAQQMFSDQNGIIEYVCKSNYYDDVPDELKAWVKTSDLIKDPMVASLYNKEYSARITKVKIIKPSVYIKTENAKGLFQEKVEKAGAKLSPSETEADIKIETQFNISKVGENNDFYTSSCSLQLDVYNSEGKLIDQKLWPAAKGVHTNQRSADDKSMENALKQIKYSWIQKIIMEHCQH